MNRLFRLLLLAVLCWPATVCSAWADNVPEFSTAGFYALPETGREVYSMNPGWRFLKGAADGAERPDFDDRAWTTVSLPDGLELLPTEASGCVNYQGEAWYRKRFTPDTAWQGRQLFLHFEAIMGHSRVWVNGRLVKEHFGGYLPVIADVTPWLKWGEENVIAVWTDNRDNPNYEDEAAGGGLFVSFGEVSEASAQVRMDVHVRNLSDRSFSGRVVCELYDREGRAVTSLERRLSVGRDKARQVSGTVTVERPHLWTPDSPYLYNLHVYVKDKNGRTVDGYRRRVGIRSIEFRGQDGFWLNGKPYPEPLIGANRHQDFAVIGNALSNSLHWRDAKKLRDAGLRVIRNAHYPQDPAFMDACDELGLFVIVNTPGWQFWNDELQFAQRVYSDIRNMVRRDRNHPSVWLWEPILNETWYPADNGGGGAYSTRKLSPDITYFTREWGDNVDDWFSHNSPSRASRAWGEVSMLVQAQGYACFDYPGFTSYDVLYRTSRQHVGGCLWHSFDHQRGYHPDPFYGGIMDAFRQPKLSYYMFTSQRPARVNPDLKADSGPMVYIAHSMTPFSPKDVTVYSNCDEVRLTFCKDGKTQVYHKPKAAEGMPSPVITFKDVFDVMQDKALARAGRHKESYLLAEGLIDGKVVATHQVFPARRPTRLLLWADDEGVPLQADGSDMVVVVAAIADDQGNIKRLNNYEVRFEVEGPATLVANEETFTNPSPVRWGTAPVLVRSTLTPGDIKVRASVVWQGKHTPLPAELVIRSVAPAHVPISR